MIKVERAQTKAKTVQSDTVGNNPRSKLPFRAICMVQTHISPGLRTKTSLFKKQHKTTIMLFLPINRYCLRLAIIVRGRTRALKTF